MDCLQLLMDQHKEAKQLFKELEKAEGAKAQQLFDELKMKLTMHEELEETHFYPELKKEKTTEELTLESYQEHHVMDVLIEEISALRPTDEAFKPKCIVLQENTEHHIEEEEGELFPKVRKIWDMDKRKEVGRKMEQMKEQLSRQQRAA
jgi:hemerythrin superfamily protein